MKEDVQHLCFSGNRLKQLIRRTQPACWTQWTEMDICPCIPWRGCFDHSRQAHPSSQTKPCCWVDLLDSCPQTLRFGHHCFCQQPFKLPFLLLMQLPLGLNFQPVCNLLHKGQLDVIFCTQHIAIIAGLILGGLCVELLRSNLHEG